MSTRIGTHLTFPGTCEEAFRFYERLLGGQLRVQTYGESPGGDAEEPEWRAKVVHATLRLGDQELAAADVRPRDYKTPVGFFVLLGLDGVPDAERVFAALADGGTVLMPIQKTFWSPAFGVVVDRFGTPWEVNAEAASV